MTCTSTVSQRRAIGGDHARLLTTSTHFCKRRPSRSMEPAHQQQPVLNSGGRSPAADAGGARSGPDGGHRAVCVPCAERHRGPAVRRPHADGHVSVLAHVCGDAHSRAWTGSAAQAVAQWDPVRSTSVRNIACSAHQPVDDSNLACGVLQRLDCGAARPSVLQGRCLGSCNGRHA